MNDLLNNKAGRLFLIDVIAIALVLLLIPVITVASDDAGENRISYSDNLYSNGESGGDKQPVVAKKNKSRNGVTAQNINGAFRIYDAWVQLYFDDDRDGYFYGIDVVFDADTDYFGAEVYAQLYLSLEGGPWEHYYTTDYFNIYGASADDEYRVETELFSGYPTGYYEVLIELYDENGFIVADIGPENTSSLSVLPLEDQQKDAPQFVHAGVSATRGGGGAAGIFSLLLLSALISLRLGKERQRC